MTYLIAGLGNPTKKYEKTRHNAGFDTVDLLAEKLGLSWKKTMFQAMVCKGVVGGKKVMLVKPLTFMNLSGNSISSKGLAGKTGQVIVKFKKDGSSIKNVWAVIFYHTPKGTEKKKTVKIKRNSYDYHEADNYMTFSGNFRGSVSVNKN